MQKIEAIIFDLGGVILNIDYNLTRRAFENYGINNFNEMYSQAAADDLFDDLETGKIKEVDFYKEFNKHTGLILSEDKIQTAWNAMLLNFREKSLEFIDSLQTKYKLFLLSNTNHIHLKAFNKIYLENKRDKPFENFFNKAYYSCEIGLRKPNANIYEFVLRENNLDAGKTLFVDDSAQNIEAAKTLGMQTILLASGKYIEDLSL
jgi:putative hydrolase of the HAD superfamily